MAHMLILLLVVVSTAAVTQACGPVKEAQAKEHGGSPIFGSLIGKCSDLKIVRRSEWGALKPKKEKRIPLPVKKLVIHHTDKAKCYTKSKCMKRVRGIQRYHMYDRKDKYGNPDTFWDIGYNYLVGSDGRAYEGRGWGYEGAHTKGYNRDAIAISAIGDYQTARPDRAVLQAIANLIDCALKEGALSPNFKMYGHKDFGGTLCPGKYLYKYVEKSSHFAG